MLHHTIDIYEIQKAIFIHANPCSYYTMKLECYIWGSGKYAMKLVMLEIYGEIGKYPMKLVIDIWRDIC
jgi:hypothetical protein